MNLNDVSGGLKSVILTNTIISLLLFVPPDLIRACRPPQVSLSVLLTAPRLSFLTVERFRPRAEHENYLQRVFPLF